MPGDQLMLMKLGLRRNMLLHLEHVYATFYSRMNFSDMLLFSVRVKKSPTTGKEKSLTFPLFNCPGLLYLHHSTFRKVSMIDEDSLQAG